jgi:hypothetical protein
LREATATGTRWQDVLFHRLDGSYDRIQRSPRTKRAEEGLEIPASTYWYVYQACRPFVKVLTVSIPPADVTVCAAAVLPFDSGGFWYGKFRTEPPIAPSERAAALASCARGVSEWRADFLEWTDAAYPTRDRYLTADKPTVSATSTFEPQYRSREDRRAWTWEAHVESSSFGASSSPVVPTRVFVARGEHRAFERWLTEITTLPNADVDKLVDWWSESARVTEDPEAELTQFLRAKLLEEK